MGSSNVSQIIVPRSTPIQQRNLTQGLEKEAEYLSLRLLNKRGRVRLSTQAIDYSRLFGKSSLLAVGNQKGCLAAAVRTENGNFILTSTLSEFRTAVESGQPEPEPFIPFQPQQPILRIPGMPNIIKFAFHDEVLIVGFVEGPILLYNTNDIFASTRTQELNPIHAFPGDASTIPRDIVPNPGETPELIAVLRGVHGQEPGHQVDILDIQQFKHIAGWRKGSDMNTAPVSISWSPKGKQIAIGLQSGDILSYTPLSPGSPKSHHHKPPSISPAASSILSLTWLANASFHTVFSSPEASSSLFDASKSSSLTKTHIISTHDFKTQSTVDVELQDPSPPFGAQFPPGPISIVLRNWSPTKSIIICGDGPSPDIGIIGSLSPDGAPDAWANFSLEETSTPSLPLGEDAQDMALLGLGIDLTSSKSVRMAEQPDDGTPDLPPSPILYAYMSDGTVVAWHVLNTKGDAYPGMVTAHPTDISISSTPLMVDQRASMEDSGMSSPMPTSLPLSSEVSTQSPPVSAFGQRPLSSSTSIAPPQGFGAFESTNVNSKFGSTGFGLAGGSGPSAFGTPSIPSPFATGFGSGDDASKRSTAPSFGSTGFGQISATPTFGTPSFGSKPAAPAFGQSGFSSSGQSKSSIPSTGGFAAFASQGTSTFGTPAGSAFSSGSNPVHNSPFGTSSSPPGPQTAFGAGGSGPATAFGQQLQQPSGTTSFGQSPGVPAFGVPGFGSKPAALTFGQSGFSSSSSSKSSIPSTGGFAAFASQGNSTFGAPTSSAFSSDSKVTQNSPFGTASAPPEPRSAFGVGSGQATATPKSAFGAGGSGQASSTPISTFGNGGSGPGTGFGQQQIPPSSAYGKTSLGDAPTSATPQSGTFSNLGALSNSLKPSVSPIPTRFGSSPGSPPSPDESPPGSPTQPSSSQPMKPASSYLKPAEGFGAFVKASGAFGAPGAVAKNISRQSGSFASMSAQQPLASASTQVKPAIPAFGSTTSGSPASPSTPTPTFGSTSTLGQTKPVFGTSTFGVTPQVKASEFSKPITGGFGAFSSGSGSFASFATTSKTTNFAEILNSSDVDKLKSIESPLAFGTITKPKPLTVPVSQTPIEEVPTIPTSGSTDAISNTHRAGDEVESVGGGVTEKSRSPEGDKTSQELLSSSDSGQGTSFSLLSLGDSSSQAGPSSISHRSPVSSTKRSYAGQSGSAEAGDNVPEAVEDSTSEAFTLSDDGLDESVSGRASQSPTRSVCEGETEGPENIPLPETPTPRTTPTSTPTSTPTVLLPKLPVIELPPLPILPTPSTSPSSVPAAEKTHTTTPPESPEKPSGPISTPLAPKPLVPPPPASPFGLGLGRPSSRPVRSSPLASAPITRTDEEDPAPRVILSKPTPATVTAKTVELETLSAQLSPPIQVLCHEPTLSSGTGTPHSANSRPKTPPLLDTLAVPGRNLLESSQPQDFPVPLKSKPLAPSAPPSLPTSNARPLAPSTSSGNENVAEEHPMQIKYLHAYQQMIVELVQLSRKAHEMTMIHPAISEPRGLDTLISNNQDFVPGKYSHGDLKYFAMMIGTLRKRVVPLLDQGTATKSLLQDLQNLTLISETKHEELSRWVQAREDPDFAKTLKSRSLGPEHAENQTRLRKALQIAQDRTQRCEDQFESLQKRLEQRKSGKVGLRPPSLDTIDRTCRNIQVALEERTKLLDQLNSRINVLSPQTSQRLHSPQYHTHSLYQMPGIVTPPFASVAAAALNSERSSLKLKNVLLSARKEPLFTNSVAKLKTTSIVAFRAQVSPQIQRPEYKLPPVPPLSNPSTSVNRRGARPGKKHGAVQLKTSTHSDSTKSVAFDWGPLPGVAPMDKLSHDVRSSRAAEFPKLTKQEPDNDDESEEDTEVYERHH